MKQIKNAALQRLVTGILVAALCFSTGLGAAQASGSKKIHINKKKISLETGKTFRLKVTGTKKKVTWSSKNQSVAAVSSKGLVKAGKTGNTKIIARVSGNKYTCRVTVTQKVYTFRSEQLLQEHYQKHGIEMGFSTMEDYVAAANAVIYSPDALHKLEAEDGDDVYYLEKTNELVIVSTDGYIRTYFCPDDGKAYFDRQ